MNWVKQISESLAALDYDFSADTEMIQAQILSYLRLIEKWNHVHNLTAIRKPEEMLYQHIMDSLAVVPHINGSQIADVGSGAGLPGIPIALAKPDWHIALLESNHKKAAFLQQVKIELDLRNVEIFAQRVECFQSNKTFDTVISRAFSSLSNFANLAGHLCMEKSETGRLVAMKAHCSNDELRELPKQYAIDKIIPLVVPGLNAMRQLVIIKKNNNNPYSLDNS